MTGRYKESRPKKNGNVENKLYLWIFTLNVFFLIIGIANLCLENEQKFFKKSAK